MNAPVSGFDFSPRLSDAPRVLRENLRELDLAVFRWARAHGASPLLASAAAWASFAEGQGDSALMLEAAHAERLGIPNLAELRQAVEAAADDPENRWVARFDATQDSAPETPFVLDADAFYLRRNFLHETAVARSLRERIDAARAPVQPVTDDELRLLFGGSWKDEEAPQREAVKRVPGKRLFVLTGAPGAGKTTTVLRMLLALAREHHAHGKTAPLIRLAAPTGKAAQRLSESLRDGAARIRGQLREPWSELLSGIENAEAMTVHRLLGSRGRAGFAHHRGHRLVADIVVLDEASMIDLGLLRALLEALPDEAALVFVGDADQLAPVGTGSVLADLVAALEGGDSLVRLVHSFRAEQELAAINAAVRDGDAEAFAAAWNAAADKAKRFPVADARDLQARLAAWLRRLHGSLRDSGAFALHAADDEVAQRRALDALKAQQLLCALREGPFGALEANRKLEQGLRRCEELADWQGRGWYPGRAVIVTRNDAASGLFNGDVGLCLRLRNADGRERLAVAFEARIDGKQALRWFDPDGLPECEPAFALTVHKSQGSEYGHVAVLLPPQAEHPLLARQMLYTALSRAKTGAELWAQDESVAACLGARLQRAGRLTQRL